MVTEVTEYFGYTCDFQQRSTVMLPARRTLWTIIILGLLIAPLSGCGKKHLHVSTTSGAPGEGEFAMGIDSSGDSTGLGDSNLSESGLANLSKDDTTSNTQDPSNLANDPIDMVSASNQDSSSPEGNNQMGDSLNPMTGSGMNEGTGDDTPGSEIQTQSPSSQLSDSLDNPGQGASENLPSTSSDATGGDDLGNQNLADSVTADLPPLIAFNTLDDPSTGTNGALDGSNDFLGSSLSGNQNGQGDSSLPVERVPENIAVAKAEPSDAFREQLEKIEAEEAAALAAGLNDVFFEFDSWSLTPEGRQVLELGAEWLQKTSSARLLVEGHCDPRGTQAYNIVLGKKRATAIRDYLVELGIPNERVGIISYGQDKPFCSDPTEVCYQLNRRGHLLVQN